MHNLNLNTAKKIQQNLNVWSNVSRLKLIVFLAINYITSVLETYVFHAPWLTIGTFVILWPPIPHLLLGSIKENKKE